MTDPSQIGRSGLTVLGISTTPRPRGNSDVLLRQALEGAEQAGGQVEYLTLRDYDFSPCVECNACYRTGVCRIQDDYQAIFPKMLSADRLIFATPVFFMAVCAPGKMLIDRCQCLWSRKYVLKQPLWGTETRDRRGAVIAVGGSRSKLMFKSIALTMKYYFDVLDVAYVANLFVNRVDARGEAEKHAEAMAEAARLGRELVEQTGPPPKHSVDVELYG